MKTKIALKNVLTILMLLLISFGLSAQQFNKKLQKYSETIIKESNSIGDDRKQVLNEIADQIVHDLKKYKVVQPLFICTHNSRRSHMGQIWLHTAAEFYGIDNIKPFSGGTEATAFNKNAVEALERAGFIFTKTQTIPGQEAYLASTGSSKAESLMFSKKYDNPVNPKNNFFAIMVCAEADKSCPVVPGADARFSLPYSDPRYFDTSISVKTHYDETCREIAREMYYLIGKVSSELKK